MKKLSKDQLRAYFLCNEALCDKVLTLFSLMANKTRFRILCLLTKSDFCVQDIVGIIDAGSFSHVSQSLKYLALAGYVTKSRQGKRFIYHLKDQNIRSMITFLKSQYLVDEPVLTEAGV